MYTDEYYLMRIKEKEEHFINLIRTKAEQLGRKAGYTPLYRKKIPDDELLSIVKDKAKELGRTPRPKDVKEYQTIINRWGSWNKVLELANMTPLSRKRQAKYTDEELRYHFTC
jgi:hypothetical protein